MAEHRIYLIQELDRQITQEAIAEGLKVSTYLKMLMEVMILGTKANDRRETVRSRIRERQMAPTH